MDASKIKTTGGEHDKLTQIIRPQIALSSHRGEIVFQRSISRTGRLPIPHKAFSERSGRDPPQNVMFDFSTLTVVDKTRIAILCELNDL